jgi:hypothetical protein
MEESVMPITFNCTCGKTLRVPDAHAGRRAKCPACNAIVPVPAPEKEPEFEIVEETPTPAATSGGKPVTKPVADAEPEGGTYRLAPERTRDDEDDAPRQKKKLPNFRRGSDNYS